MNRSYSSHLASSGASSDKVAQHCAHNHRKQHNPAGGNGEARIREAIGASSVQAEEPENGGSHANILDNQNKQNQNDNPCGDL